jgi:hypothetical protein
VGGAFEESFNQLFWSGPAEFFAPIEYSSRGLFYTYTRRLLLSGTCGRKNIACIRTHTPKCEKITSLTSEVT